MNTDIINKAFRTCKRNITRTQKGGVLTRMVRLTGNKCRFEVDHKIDTACWSFDHAKDMHHIKCGTSLDKIANASTNACDKKMKAFVECVIRHETEHGICTDRSTSVPEACQKNDIPFRLWNLFEDVRIEYASATRADGDGAFRWVKFQDVDASFNLASGLLWAIKTNEAGIKKSASAYVPAWSGADYVNYQGKSKKTRLVVLDFYRRACACATSMALIPVLLEWIDIFGKEVPKQAQDSTINGVADPSEPEAKGEDYSPASASDPSAKGQDKNDWRQRNRAMNDSQISRIARAMNAVIQNAKVVKNKLACNGTRIHASQAMQGSEKSFLSRGRSNGKRSVTLIVDASGSMGEAWSVHGGKEFVLAFRQLAKQSKIDLEIILTQIQRSDRKAVSTRIDKQSDQWINNLLLDGDGEGVMQCLKRWMPTIKKSTTSVIFTDAQLTDDDIDTQQYRNLGLNMIAAYIEPNPNYMDYGRKRMNDHFARSVIAESATELASRLMREILKD